MSKQLIIWGGTGNFMVLCELLKEDYDVLGYFDNNTRIQKEYKGIPYLGDRDAFLKWIDPLAADARPFFIVSIGPGHGAARRQVHEELKDYGLKPIRAVHRRAFVADSVRLGEGSMVYANAAVCVDAQIGKCCMINTSASVDHECVLEDGATIGPGAILAGLVHIEQDADVYTGAVILPRARIGAGAIVGAGAVVIKDVPAGAVVVGNPARVIKT